MKNITVSIDDETYRLSRVKAAENGTSVSALVRDYLLALAQGRVIGSEFNRLSQLQDNTLEELRARGAGLRAADNLPRGALQERRAKYDLKEMAFANNDPKPILEKFYTGDVLSVGPDGVSHEGTEGISFLNPNQV